MARWTKSQRTKAVRNCWAFVSNFYEAHGWVPSLDEMVKGLKLSSKCLVYQRLKALEKAGYIEERTPRYASRAFRIVIPFCTAKKQT